MFPGKKYTSYDWECHFVRTKLCTSRLKIHQYADRAVILVSEPHDLDSHNHLRDREPTQLTWDQKQAARAQAKMNPLATVNEKGEI